MLSVRQQVVVKEEDHTVLDRAQFPLDFCNRPGFVILWTPKAAFVTEVTRMRTAPGGDHGIADEIGVRIYQIASGQGNQRGRTLAFALINPFKPAPLKIIKDIRPDGFDRPSADSIGVFYRLLGQTCWMQTTQYATKSTCPSTSELSICSSRTIISQLSFGVIPAMVSKLKGGNREYLIRRNA
jgi:hypothetical protein